MDSKHLTVFIVIVVTLGSVGATGAVATQGDAMTTNDHCEFPVVGTDATGTEVTVDEPPERIVPLQPSTSQIAWEIGAWDRVVGAPVGEYIAYLDGYDEPEDVTEDDDLTPEAERIIDLEPDLVLASGVQDDDQIDQLREADITVFKFETPDSIDTLYNEIQLTGQLTGECDGADETIEWMQAEISIAEEAAEGEDRPLAFYPMGGGYTAGEGTFTDEIITAAGGENFGTKAGIEFYEIISEETVVDEDPEWIVYPDAFDEPPVDGTAIEGTTAWENDQVVAVNSSYMNQPGPRIVYPIQELVEAFRPEAYAEAQEDLADDNDDAVETADATQVDESEELDDDQQENEQTADGTPGFGIVVGMVGVILASLFAVRKL